MSGEESSWPNSAKDTSPRLGFIAQPPVGFQPLSPGRQLSMIKMLLSLLITCAAALKSAIAHEASKNMAPTPALPTILMSPPFVDEREHPSGTRARHWSIRRVRQLEYRL